MSNKVAVTSNVTKHVVEVTPDTASTTLVVSQQTAPNVVEFNAGLFLGTSDLSSINNLGDVNTSGISMGDVLQYNGSEWVTVDVSIITGPQTLASLNDVTITTASDGDFLRHNGVAWVDAVIQKADISDFSDLDYATALQGATADSALQPGDIGVTVQGYDANLVSDATYVATDENFTTADHAKLDGIAAGAEVNVNADWNAVSGDGQILNKPVLGTAATTNSTDYATAAQGVTADAALPTTGGAMTGAITTTSTFDGRDVATDGAKLDGIAAGATANSTDATLLARANHTGTQAASTIIDFDTEVSNNTSVAANTAKVSADGLVTTHSDVTSAGSGAIITSAERTKLSGIETSATGDQTAAEIKTAYESNANTNAFTDAAETKLSGIEANADVTDTINVTAAGALMDSEVTNLAQVKAFNSADYATSAQGTTADSALQPTDIGTSVQSYNVNTVIDATYVATDQNFTNADHTKLDGIQAGAEVNVNADWSAVAGDAQILNKPTLGTAAATDSTAYATSAQGLLADSALQPSDNISELTNDSGYLTNLSASSIGQLSDVTLTSPIAGGLLVEQAGGGFLKLGGSTWATNYLDLSNLKDVTITTPLDGQVLSYDLATSKWVNSSLATVATSGDYNDLINTPTGGSTNVLDGQKVEYFTRSTAYGNGSYEGKILKFGTAALQSTKLYRYGASGWEASDANVVGKAEGLLGLALGASEANDGLLVDGLISSSAFSAFSAGDTIYVSETEGAMTNTAPTAQGSIVRIVGYALGSSFVHFNPSDNFIELA